MLFLGALSSASSQVVLNCNFTLFVFNEYGCVLNGITVLDPSASVSFTGQHIGDRTNEDVEIVEIVNSYTPFIIPQIFSTFQNLIELEVRNGGLQSISLPDESNRLQYLTLLGNNISRIENGTFRNHSNLAVISLNSNLIQEVEEAAFEVGTVTIFVIEVK